MSLGASERVSGSEGKDWGREVEARLPGPVGRILARFLTSPVRPLEELKGVVAEYLDELRRKARSVEFLDVATAERALDGCLRLLDAERGTQDASRQRVVQAAVEYYLLRKDAEEDTSIVGFDDDLQVIQVTAEVLGHRLEGGGDGG